jgi:uncharacterized membrane protein
MSQEPMSDVTPDDKLWAALAYVIPVIIPIVLLLMADKKDRPFIKAHNIQALILGILVYVLSFACVGILVWVYMLYLAYQAYQGKIVEVPVITSFCKNQGWA